MSAEISEIKNSEWSILVKVEGRSVILDVSNGGYVHITPEEIDALVRALSAARVKISAAKPQS